MAEAGFAAALYRVTHGTDLTATRALDRARHGGGDRHPQTSGRAAPLPPAIIILIVNSSP
jgi:hypothetical protein